MEDRIEKQNKRKKKNNLIIKGKLEEEKIDPDLKKATALFLYKELGLKVNVKDKSLILGRKIDRDERKTQNQEEDLYRKWLNPRGTSFPEKKQRNSFWRNEIWEEDEDWLPETPYR